MSAETLRLGSLLRSVAGVATDAIWAERLAAQSLGLVIELETLAPKPGSSILFGEKSLRHALREHVIYHYHERNHQGKEHLLLFPASDQLPQSERKVRSRERLGGLLRFYHRAAA